MCCQRTTKAVIYILECDGILLDVYIDDFFGAEHDDVADIVFQRIIGVFKELTLLAAEDRDGHAK